MTTYRLMDGVGGRPGNGPSAAVSYSGDFLAGTAFQVTADNLWLEGFWWWVCDSGQQTGAQSFTLWQVDNTDQGMLVPHSAVTSGTLTAGTWNYIALATPIALSRGIPYVATTGYNSTLGFPNTNGQFGPGATYSAGIANGPLMAYSDTTGSAPSPNKWIAQGLFGVGTSDPTAQMPSDSYDSGNFWIDLQVSDTAPSGTSYRLWPGLPDPPNRLADDSLNFTIATEFVLSASCALDKIWFYSPPGTSQLPTECGIWNVSSQALVAGTDNASPSWSGAAGSGWVSCDYSSAGITLTANTKFKVSVVNGSANPDSWNSATIDYWSTGTGGNGISSGPLMAPNETDATSPGQSSYHQGTAFAYPDTYDTGGAPNYWVDVEVTPSSATPTANSGAFLAFFP
jgi:Domain of unknown function (DUF4082)